MRSLFTLVTLFALSTPSVVLAGSSCIAFDASWNLLAFGFNGKDYNAGTSDTWASGMSLKHPLGFFSHCRQQVPLLTSPPPDDREFRQLLLLSWH